MRILLTALLLVTSLTVGTVHAHGEKPRHGGVMSEANELNFELVADSGNAAIYVLDHGAMVPTTKASGKLLVLSGGKKTEVALVPAGDNKLVTASAVSLAAGTKAIATLDLGDKQTISVRFAVK